MIFARGKSARDLIAAAVLWMVVGMAGHSANAQTVTARSGEHEGFTRIVLDFGSVVDWTVGRMPDGYALRLKDRAAAYDLTEVFNRIGKSRLGSIWADPESGDLVFSANCPCHAIAFEFRPGTVVIDLKDGPPPTGSGFEAALDANEPPKPESRPTQMGESLPEFDWTRPEMVLADPSETLGRTSALPLANPTESPAETSAAIGQEENAKQTDAALAAFEENLRAELAGAASIGIVDLAQPAEAGQPVAQTNGGVLDQFRIGRKGEAELGQAATRQAGLDSAGDLCPPNDALDIAAWGDREKPVADQIADMRSGLVGEFDLVDPEKLKGAIRFHLFLGFGAEVQELLAAFKPEDPDAALWAALAHLLEGETQTTDFFTPMQACQGPAALWAILASSENPAAGFDRKPALLAFSALPVHLRRHLGPRLVDRFLAMGDAEGARILSDAIFRPGATDAPGIDLMKARISLDKGNSGESESILRERIAKGGPDQIEAYIALVDLLAAQRKPMTADEALAISALIDELPDAEMARRTLALAQAASGDFSAAFGGNQGNSGVSSDLWGFLAANGTDNDLLVHAVLEADALPGEVQPIEAIRIAERLLDLGLPKESLRWQNWAALPPTSETPDILAARTDLALGMTSKALARLKSTGEQDEITRELVIQTLGAAGDDAGQAAALDPADPRKAAALGRAGDWQELAHSAEGPWAALAKDLAAELDATASDESREQGPLAKSDRLVRASAETRDRIQSLLASTAKPQS